MEGYVGRQARVHCRGGGGPCPPPPLEMGKKMFSEEILTSFTYVLLMKLVGIDIHCIHAKWKGVGGQALVHGGRGWLPCPPPLENEKKAVRGNFNLFHLCNFTNEISGDRHTLLCPP